MAHILTFSLHSHSLALEINILVNTVNIYTVIYLYTRTHARWYENKCGKTLGNYDVKLIIEVGYMVGHFTQTNDVLKRIQQEKKYN